MKRKPRRLCFVARLVLLLSLRESVARGRLLLVLLLILVLLLVLVALLFAGDGFPRRLGDGVVEPRELLLADGKSTWLKGLALIVWYVAISAAFCFFAPSAPRAAFTAVSGSVVAAAGFTEWIA